jgi:hypothetical protein
LGEKAKDAAVELVKKAAAREMLAAIDKWRSGRISTRIMISKRVSDRSLK